MKLNAGCTIRDEHVDWGQIMIDFVARVLSITVPASASAILGFLAYWIHRQEVSSRQAKFSGSNLAIFVLFQSFFSISVTIRHMYEAIQAEVYELWAIKFCYFLASLSTVFLLNAISVSTVKQVINSFKEWFKKDWRRSSATLSLQAFGLVCALVVFLPDAILGKEPSFWYGSLFLMFSISVTIALIAFLQTIAGVSAYRKTIFAVWGSATGIWLIQFSHLFIERFEGTSPFLASFIYLVAVFLGGVMIHVGFTENTAFERFALPIPVAEHVLDLKEGESVILTYSSAADKMKVFSAFIRGGLEAGDAVFYLYPDEESETVRPKLKEHGVNVEKYEKDDTLRIKSLTELFMSDGKLDFEKAVNDQLTMWAEKKRRGYNHVRTIEDVGDFSFFTGQWQPYVKDYWLDPRWNDPNVSEWVKSDEPVGVVYDSFLMEITALNVEHMTETQVTEILKTIGGGPMAPATFVDLINDTISFSKSIGLDHKRLVDRKILLEFDPTSNYEKVVDSLAKEAIANVEPIFVFTSSTSPIHTYLAKQPATNFFLTSLSTSIPKSTSENKVLLPAKNTPLILDAINKVLETHANANICFVFDIISELLTTVGLEKTFNFMRHALDLLSSERTTSLFLLNANSHESQVVSQLRNLFSNQLTCGKNGLEIVKIP